MQPDNNPGGNWNYRQEGGGQPQVTDARYQMVDDSASADQYPESDIDTITWTASEFIANQKTAEWHLGIIGGALFFAIVVFILTRDYISSGAIIIVSILFVIIGNHKPRQVTYTLDFQGLSIGEKFYPFSLFKSFAIMQDGAFNSINLIPLKRFMPELSIYYAPTDEPKILDILSNSLPNDQRGERATDKLMKRLRF
jgi:hypothetical protein